MTPNPDPILTYRRICETLAQGHIPAVSGFYELLRVVPQGLEAIQRVGELEAEVLALRRQVEGHAARIVGQSELLSAAAERATLRDTRLAELEEVARGLIAWTRGERGTLHGVVSQAMILLEDE